jgi:hypothetical protein
MQLQIVFFVLKFDDDHLAFNFVKLPVTDCKIHIHVFVFIVTLSLSFYKYPPRLVVLRTYSNRRHSYYCLRALYYIKEYI